MNAKKAGSHTGGYTSFSFDVTDLLEEGENTLCVYAEDHTRSGRQPHGKQCNNYYSGGCDYTRTTGIWQTVWLERVPASHIVNFRIYPNITEPSVDVEVDINCAGQTASLTLEAAYDGEAVGSLTVPAGINTVRAHLPLSRRELWGVRQGPPL